MAEQALFRCARPSGVPRGPAVSTGSLAGRRWAEQSQHKGEFLGPPGPLLLLRPRHASLGPYHFRPLSCPSLHEMFPGISNFLEEISSLSHSIVFLYFFALITEEGFLMFPCYSLELCIQMGICFLRPMHPPVSLRAPHVLLKSHLVKAGGVARLLFGTPCHRCRCFVWIHLSKCFCGLVWPGEADASSGSALQATSKDQACI